MKKLEAKIGKRFPELPLNEIFSTTNGYSNDDKGYIVDLNLYRKKIGNIPDLRDFPRLIYLELSNDKIIDLSPLFPSTKLRYLDMRSNKISCLAPEWAVRYMNFKWENDLKGGLFLEGNPLDIPPVEIVRQGHEAVRTYFEEIEKDTVLLLQAKLLLGSGGVGKTTLMKKLHDLSSR